MEAIVLLGPPGTGKGTVSEKLKEATKYVHVSTGDMLRKAIKENTPAGLNAKGYMDRGELVPDEVIIKLVEDRLEKDGDGAYMFDGFPRTVTQAELLEKTISKAGGNVSHVIYLDAPNDVLMKRLTGRRTCRKCGANYHIVNIPPKKEGVCDVCGGELYQRPDDREETILNRLKVYEEQTKSLVKWYEDKGILQRVNSDQGVTKLIEQITGIIGA